MLQDLNNESLGQQVDKIMRQLFLEYFFNDVKSSHADLAASKRSARQALLSLKIEKRTEMENSVNQFCHVP
jgi:hypothetical protein